MPVYRAGGEIDAFCTKCKMVLAHTILAMEAGKPARVQCNTCNGQHNYRGAGDATPAKAPRAVKSGESTRSQKIVVSFDDEVATKKGPAKAYSIKVSFGVDDVVDHPTFGRGYVTEVRGEKIDVTFRGGARTLLHGRR